MSLEATVAQLLAENARLRAQLGGEVDDDRFRLCVEYIYAAPLVLLDSMGSTVIETFDPLRTEAELAAIKSSADSVSVTVATISNLAALKRTASSAFWLTHIAMHTVESGSLRCALEDESGKGFLVSPQDLALSLSLEGKSTVFVNACKSLEIAQNILAVWPNVREVICLSEPVLESSALLFASEFYAALKTSDKNSVQNAFDRGQTAVRLSSKPRVAAQFSLFKLVVQQQMARQNLGTFGDNRSHFYATRRVAPGWLVGHVDPVWAEIPEDYVGRQVDTVRLCARLFGRRVCAITGPPGIGKSTFLAEAAKFFSSPGGRHFAGGVCLVDLKQESNNFLSLLTAAVSQTVSSLKQWYEPSLSVRSPEIEEDTFDVNHKLLFSRESSARERVDSEMSETSEMVPSYGLKSYKVFWAETFATETELAIFLKSYKLVLSDVGRLFSELRLNGTQLQDWGAGRLIRVVHVVRLLIRGENNTVLVEDQQVVGRRLPSKKFDPVTENVLEIASITVRKEFPLTGVSITKIVLQDRKPLIEINKTSPSYPGLATKYVLYTAEVGISGLPSSASFTTTEENGGKQHVWRWLPAESDEVAGLQALRRSSQRLEMSFSSMGVANLTADTSGVAWNKCLREWSDLVTVINRNDGGGVSAGLVLLGADEYILQPSVCEILGKALSRHPNLRILFSLTNESNLVQTLTTASVSYKVVQFPLAPLEPIEAAILFTRRIHRPLFPRDWQEEAPPPLMTMGSSMIEFIEESRDEEPLGMSPRTSQGVANLARLARHPLIQSLEGIPARILAAAKCVTFQLTSLNDLVT